MTQPYYPNLDQKTPYDVAQGIRTAYDFIHKLTARVEQMEKAGVLTPAVAFEHLGPSATKNNLQAGGKAPLNVQGLLGQLAQPQIADAVSVPSLPPITSPLSQDGTLVAIGTQVYRFDGTTDPGSWQPITAAPVPGTSVTSLDSITGAVTLVAGANFIIVDNSPSPGDISIKMTSTINLVPALFATLPAASGVEGTLAAVTDSTTAVWGATITGGGTDHVLAYSDGTNWTVAAS